MRRGIGALIVASLLACGACSGGGEADDRVDGTLTTGPAGPPAEDTVSSVADVLPPLDRLRVAVIDGRPVIVDASGREVLLRGTNLNNLADYHQADPTLDPTVPLTDADWDQMAAAGFDVVRLLVSWSRLEPERGAFDLGYVQEVQHAVEAAAARRMHTVIDMHQDAWGKAIATPPGTTCAEGTEPAIGWDGAPEWATITDDADTCRPMGNREGAPAVQAAFRSFYENRDGIRDAFVTTWARLAGVFAQDPNVAGFDLFNEPSMVLPAAESEQRYTELADALVRGIRVAELSAGGFPHMLFLEPMLSFPLPGTMPSEDFTTDGQIVFAPHSYAEVIGPTILTVEQTMDAASQTARARGWPLWIGEHGIFSTDPDALAVGRRVAVAQDDVLAGGAWWQWRQRCGDPHTVGSPGATPTTTVVQLNDVSCPGDLDQGADLALLSIAGRAYPRATPGLLTDVVSDLESGSLHVEGTVPDDLAERDALILWFPGPEAPTVSGEGIGEATVTRVTGGHLVEVAVEGTPWEVDLQ